MSRLGHWFAEWRCNRFGHARLKWYTAKQHIDDKPVRLRMCPRCQHVVDVERRGNRRERRKVWKRDWKQVKDA